MVGRGDLKVGLYLAKNALRKRRENGAIERQTENEKTKKERTRKEREE